MISIMVVLASVGGALAFKAHSAYSGGNVYIKATPTATKCTLRAPTLNHTGINGDVISSATYPSPGDCDRTLMITFVQ